MTLYDTLQVTKDYIARRASDTANLTAEAARATFSAARTTGNFFRNLDYNPVHWYNGTKRILRDTSAEILVCGIGACLIGGAVLYLHESERSKRIPLGFSEISQIERDAEKAGEELGPMNRYLPKTNDAPMKVFESWDLGNESIVNQRERFVQELEFHVDPAFKTHHYNLPMLLEELPERANEALVSLKDFSSVMQRVRPVNREFHDAWSDYHEDVFRTEFYTETETDSDGNSHTELKSRQVYDHTDHTYTYRKNHGEAASRLLDALILDYPELRFNEKLRTASQTNAEGEYAIERSRRGERKRNSNFDFLQISNTWKTGSTLEANLPGIYSMWGELHSDDNLWRRAKSIAYSKTYPTGSITYPTGSHSDPGPKEFQIARAALSHGINLDTLIFEIIDGIQYTKTHASILDAKSKELIAVALDKKPGNKNKLIREVMDISKEMYVKNFKRGFDVYRFRGEMVALGMLIGLFAGGLAGYGLDKVTDKYGFWGKFDYRDKE